MDPPIKSAGAEEWMRRERLFTDICSGRLDRPVQHPHTAIMREGWFNIMANRRNGTLYCGSTTDLFLRSREHKARTFQYSFTAKYDCTTLVYFEHFDSLHEAVARENAVKRYKRQWKIELIEATNPNWNDLDPM